MLRFVGRKGYWDVGTVKKLARVRSLRAVAQIGLARIIHSG